MDMQKETEDVVPAETPETDEYSEAFNAAADGGALPGAAPEVPEGEDGSFETAWNAATADEEKQ